MNTFKLEIVSADGKIYENRINALTAPGRLGSFGVWAQHAPLIASLASGIIKVTEEDKRELFFVVHSGILEVNAQGEVLVLADHVQTAKLLQEAKQLCRDASWQQQTAYI